MDLYPLDWNMLILISYRNLFTLSTRDQIIMCPHKNYIDLYVIKKYINQQNSRYTNHYTHKRNYHLKQISYKSVSTPYNLIA